MILLDTHAWGWWIQDENKLTKTQSGIIKANKTDIMLSRAGK